MASIDIIVLVWLAGAGTIYSMDIQVSSEEQAWRHAHLLFTRAIVEPDDRGAQELLHVHDTIKVNAALSNFNRLPFLICLKHMPYSACKKIFEMLLQADIDVNAIDEYGQTPLYHVAKASQFSDWQATILARMLLQKGADPNILTHYRMGPLFLALAHDKPLLSAALLEYGALIFKKGKNGLSAMNALLPGWESKKYVDEINSIYDWVADHQSN